MKIERLKPELQYDESWIEQKKQYYINVEGYDEQDALDQATADYEEIKRLIGLEILKATMIVAKLYANTMILYIKN